MKNWKNKIIAGGLVMGSTVAARAEIDFSALQTGITSEIPGIIAAGMAIAGAAVLLMAAPKGVRFIKKMWAAIAG
ncbi:hypothetical protein H5P28_07105 [Ruficoccus amylovorans]|uniref:Uncharacterized protein n=1 Tax=Ruficoccus amylovorans TaxID=1804625 RepID=A0A842HEM3_9BACT|nr:hypothetical protein [Ruficoccus amylovorans]MBC2594027.1 hypothetical protein [Ruficoccus amylovorans]